MSKERDMESKKPFMYVNPTISSNAHVTFSLCSLSTVWNYVFWLLFALCFLKLFFLFLIDIENVRNS